MWWLTSDHHFGHKMIITYEDRPFTDVDEMDRVMIDKWNDVVKDGDVVFHLGDFSFHNVKKSSDILSELRGEKILVLGNHDGGANRMASVGFAEVHKALILYHDDPWSHGYNSSYMLLTHRPVRWVGSRQLNVAVECWDYYPVPVPTPRLWLNVHGHIHRSGIVRGI